jgi:hypothetical protein
MLKKKKVLFEDKDVSLLFHILKAYMIHVLLPQCLLSIL